MQLCLAQETVVVRHRRQSEVNKATMKPQLAQAKVAACHFHLL
jgi:hypothetical protein